METIGNYNIRETIAEHGPFSVYLAEHQKLRRKTLLKVYKGGDRSLIERFEREARIVADINNEAVVEIYDFGESEGKFFISMEYVEGSNLHDFLQANHRLNNETIIELAGKIALSVSALHNMGYVHRDLKPENIMVDPNHDIKLTDFGISLHASLNRLTSEDALVGTPMYMSPEQINNVTLTPASDVFALGIIFYQIATGTHPFEANQYGEIFSRILAYDPPNIHEVNEHLPLWFSKLVKSMLSKEPHQRPKDADAVLSAIRNHVDDQTKFSFYKNQSSPRNGRKQNIRLKQTIIVILIFLAVLGGGYFVFDDQIANRMFPGEPALITDSLHRNDSMNRPLANISKIKESSPDPLSKYSEPDDNETKKTDVQQPLKDSLFSNENLPEVHPDSNLILKDEKTSLFIRTVPWCDIYINYQYIEQTPIKEPIPIKAGQYVIGLQNPNYPSYSDSITIRPNRKNVFTYYLDSLFYRLELEVVPWGKVYIDNKLIGTTPLKEPVYLSREDHPIRIVHDYFGTLYDTLQWSGESHIKRTIVLNDRNTATMNKENGKNP